MGLFHLIDPEGEEIQIEGKVVFGRGSECAVRLQDSQVSRKHAAFFMSENQLFVQDEGSANGTFVNEKRIEKRTALKVGDQVRLGSTMYTVGALDEQDVTPTVFAEDLDLPAAEVERESQEADAAQDGIDPEPVATEREPAKQRRSPLMIVGIGCGILVVIGICLLAAGLLLTQTGIIEDLFNFDDLFSSSGSVPDYTLGEVLAEETVDDRPGVIGYLGVPDAFTISEIVLEGTPVRVETWRYFAFELRVDFVDGEATWTMDIEPAPEDSILPAWYNPLAFELGMSATKAADIAASASPANMTPELIELSEGGEDLQGGSMLVGDQIILGIDESGLIYVETIGLFPEGEGGT